MKKQIALIAVCAVLAVCVLTAGCSGPTASPTPSPSVTPTPSATPTPSPSPSSSPAKLTLMFFYRPTCPKCQATEPIVTQLQTNYTGKVTVQRLNDDDPAYANDVSQYRASIVPTMILLNNGVEVQRWVYPIDYTAVAEQIDSQLSTG